MRKVKVLKPMVIEGILIYPNEILGLVIDDEDVILKRSVNGYSVKSEHSKRFSHTIYKESKEFKLELNALSDMINNEDVEETK